MLRVCRAAGSLALLHRGERGQALIFFIGIITLIMGMAALAVDVGLWYTDRAVARKDADAAASAAVNEYDPDTGSTAGATLEAQDWAGRNGVAPGDVTVTTGDCLNTSNAAVVVDVQRQSSLLFGGFFPSVNAPDTPGRASACVASASTIQGGAGPAIGRVRPIAVVKNYDDAGVPGAPSCLDGAQLPHFGTECVLFLRRPGSGFPGTGWERIVDLNGPGPACSGGPFALGDIDINMATGSPDTCSIDNPLAREVIGTAGQIPGRATVAIDNSQQGLDDLLQLNDCDPNGVDDFNEVVVDPDGNPGVPGAGLFARQNCDGDRLVLLPVIDTRPVNNGTQQIRAFMPFFVTGCLYQIVPAGPLVSDADCDGNVPGPNFDPANDAFGVAGYPIQLQEPVDGPVRGFDNYGARRTFLYEE